MSEQFILCQDDLGNYEIRYDDKVFHFLWEVAPILNEQQATINRLEEEIKLLKPTNIEQYEQIVQLQEENEQLRKELGDCEKFRYTVFKRLNDEHIKECSIR